MPDHHLPVAEGMGLRQTVHPVQYHQAVAVSEDLKRKGKGCSVHTPEFRRIFRRVLKHLSGGYGIGAPPFVGPDRNIKVPGKRCQGHPFGRQVKTPQFLDIPVDGIPIVGNDRRSIRSPAAAHDFEIEFRNLRIQIRKPLLTRHIGWREPAAIRPCSRLNQEGRQ